MKQGHVAELLGVSQATISRWESGHQLPTLPEREALRALMAARLDSAADRALGRLVCSASREIHLVCDLTHRLLAASPARERRWRVSASELMGTSMWRFHTEAIALAEAALPALGWYGDAPPEVEVRTGANESAEVPIRRGRCRWTRLRLSDGGYARLVETDGRRLILRPDHGEADRSMEVLAHLGLAATHCSSTTPSIISIRHRPAPRPAATWSLVRWTWLSIATDSPGARSKWVGMPMIRKNGW